jgi:Arc/MetJ family transcription regulator
MYRGSILDYTRSMVQRTTVELDPERLAEVRAILGTTGIKDTIDAAFARVLGQARREALLAQLASADGLDLGPDMLAEARPRTP